MTFRKSIFIILTIIISTMCFSNDLKDNDMSSGIKSYQNSKFLDSIYYMNIVISKDNLLLSEAIFWKAKSLYEMGLYKESKAELEIFFENSLVDTNYYEDARFLYCKIFFKLEKYEDALLLFNQFIRNTTFTYYANASHFWIGETYLQLSRLELAKESFETYLKLNTKSVITKQRIDMLENMLAILDYSKSNNISPVDRAGWLSEYVLKEQQNTTVNEEMYISNFLNKFNNKTEFFDWLEKYYLLDNEKNSLNNNLVDTETQTKKSNEKLDFIEKALLNELELELLSNLGDDN